MEYKKGWYKDENFWNNYAQLMFAQQSWEDAYFEVTNIVKLLALKPGSSVLDSCCGPGRHSLEFARARMNVTGVDLNHNYIEAARETAEDMEEKIIYHEADVLDFVQPQQFDLAVNLYTSFGYFEDDSDDLNYLKKLHASLKPGGRVLIDTIGKELILKDFKEDEWFEENGMTVCLGFEITEDFRRLINRWMMIDSEGNRQDYKFSHRLFSAYEMKQLLESAGFKEIKIYGSLEGSPYDHHAKRLIAVGVK